MRNHALLRLLLSAFFLYIAWPVFPHAYESIAILFWSMWMIFFLLVAGANLALLMQLSPSLRIEQEQKVRKRSGNH